MVSEPYVRSQTWGGIATSTFQIYALHYRVVIPIFAILLLPFWMLWDLVLPTATMGQALLLLTINSILQILGTGVLTVAIHDICMGNEQLGIHLQLRQEDFPSLSRCRYYSRFS